MKTVDELLEFIDNMEINERQYDIISNLVKNSDKRLFLKILEEISEKELFWEDFERNFSNTDYPTVLMDTIKEQDKLYKYMDNLVSFRKQFYQDPKEYEENDETSHNVLSDKDNDFYKEELDNIKKNLLFSITNPSPNDTPLTQAYKIKLYKSMWGKTRIINPDDILLFLGTYLIPIDYKNQILDEMDRTYMIKNGLSEELMKKMKSLALYFRRMNYLDSIEAAGGSSAG